MKIKAVDIARHLGISKATVSLALNDRPGVSEATREKVLECKAWMEKEQKKKKSGGVIKYIFLNDRPLDLGLDSRLNFGKRTREGIEEYLKDTCYTLDPDLRIFAESIEGIYQAAHLCNQEKAAGAFIIFSDNLPNLSSEDLSVFGLFQMPIVLYDSDIPTLRYDQVRAGNGLAAEIGLRHLYNMGHRHVSYLRTGNNINYNLTRRFEGAQKCIQYLVKSGMRINFVCIRDTDNEKLQRNLAASVDAHHREIRDYLHREKNLPTGFVCDNYVASAVLIEELDKIDLKVPQDCSVVGIDPPWDLVKGNALTYVDLLDDRRGRFAIQRLVERIEGESLETIQCEVAPILVRGNTVRKLI